MPRIPLLHLVSDLVADDELRLRFVRKPQAILEQYGLSPEDRALLLQMDRNRIAQEIAAAISGYQPPEMLPDDADFLAEAGGIDPKYPSPRPGLFRIRPDRIDAAEVTKRGGTFELRIYGQSFTEAKITIVRTSDQKSARLSFPFSFGTFRCSLLRVVVGPVAGENAFKPGDRFRVSVINLPGTQSQETFSFPRELVVE